MIICNYGFIEKRIHGRTSDIEEILSAMINGLLINKTEKRILMHLKRKWTRIPSLANIQSSDQLSYDSGWHGD